MTKDKFVNLSHEVSYEQHGLPDVTLPVLEV